MDAKRLVITRQLPKTGQTISYRVGDDGTYEAGWWRGRLNADNKTRFVVILINTDRVTVDLATGLMWATDGVAEGCNRGIIARWTSAIGFANALGFAGFTDWRVPNIKELISIVDFSMIDPSIDVNYFVDTALARYWASTTSKTYSGYAWVVNFSIGSSNIVDKNSSYYLRCVRGGL